MTGTKDTVPPSPLILARQDLGPELQECLQGNPRSLAQLKPGPVEQVLHYCLLKADLTTGL